MGDPFSKLRTDKGRYRYPPITRHRAPHKPFLLLSVMELIAGGWITGNFIEPSFTLPVPFTEFCYDPERDPGGPLSSHLCALRRRDKARFLKEKGGVDRSSGKWYFDLN